MASPRRPGGFAQEAQELVSRARAYERQGAVREAGVAYDMAIAIADGAPIAPLHADLHRWKGTLRFDVGATGEAEALFRRSLEIAQHIRYSGGVGRAQTCLALVHQRRGDLAAARRLLDDASLRAVTDGDQRLFARIEEHLGTLSSSTGDVEDAAHRFRQSLRAFRDAGDEQSLAWALDNVARLHAQRRRHAEAAEALEEGRTLAQRHGNVFLEGMLETTRAEVLLDTGRASEAEGACDRALLIARRRGDRVRMAIALRLRARLQRLHGELVEAGQSLEEARELAQQSEEALVSARVLRDLGELAAQRGDLPGARTAFERSLATYARLGMPPEAVEVGRRLDSRS